MNESQRQVQEDYTKVTGEWKKIGRILLKDSRWAGQ